MSDNTTAIAYINKMGGTHCMVMNDLAVEFWKFCLSTRLFHMYAATTFSSSGRVDEMTVDALPSSLRDILKSKYFFIDAQLEVNRYTH